MAVITRYIVIRNEIELDQVFTDKKEAEAFDRMLEASENLSKFIKAGEHDVQADDETIDAISVFLAQNAPEVTKILKSIRSFSAPSSKSSKKEKTLPPPEQKPTDEKKKQREIKAKSARKGSA